MEARPRASRQRYGMLASYLAQTTQREAQLLQRLPLTAGAHPETTGCAKHAAPETNARVRVGHACHEAYVQGGMHSGTTSCTGVREMQSHVLLQQRMPAKALGMPPHRLQAKSCAEGGRADCPFELEAKLVSGRRRATCQCCPHPNWHGR